MGRPGRRGYHRKALKMNGESTVSTGGMSVTRTWNGGAELVSHWRGCGCPDCRTVAWDRAETDYCERGTQGCSVLHTRDSECETW